MRLWAGINFVDDCSLLAVGWSQCWLKEWCSVTQRALENGMVGMYAAAGLCVDMEHRWFGWMPLTVVVAGVLWLETLRPDAMRVAKLMDRVWTVVRVFNLAIVALLLVNDVVPPFRWHHVISSLPMVSMTLIHLSTSLPEFGEKGRKREEASEEVREWLRGLHWLPVPAGGAAA